MTLNELREWVTESKERFHDDLDCWDFEAFATIEALISFQNEAEMAEKLSVEATRRRHFEAVIRQRGWTLGYEP